jgi:uncharacterized protein (DUF302 family)
VITYGFKKEIYIGFKETIDILKEALKKEGFGILTQIDLKEKFKEKLGIDFKNYVILGACNPSNAYKAILAEEDIGLLLPCNVIVYEKEGKTVISIIRPKVAMNMVNNKDLVNIAMDVEAKLKRVFDSIE